MSYTIGKPLKALTLFHPHWCLAAKICLQHIMALLFLQTGVREQDKVLEEVLSFQKLFTEWKSDSPGLRNQRVRNGIQGQKHGIHQNWPKITPKLA